ncbi:MAG: translation initiation factor IF-2, partial [Candidatus Aenigmatarchaeota archaeon]
LSLTVVHMTMRQPIIVVLGHVDHGKTTLLDRIRQTAVAAKEAGGITQAIGSTEIPASTLEKLCGSVMQKFNFELAVPGLLFIDTPGHEAFTTLRRRGGSVADLAIIVVDIVEGMMPQTSECIEIIKEIKTPFVVAVNKIDRIADYNSIDGSFLENYERQSDAAKVEFEKDFYSLVNQFTNCGFSVERFDRITDFKKTIAAVPISGKTGEGINELLAILVGLSQQFLGKQLETSSEAKGMILDVKDVTGFGTTIDVIVYDGSVSKGDFLIVGGREGVITGIKALLMPQPLHDTRVEKKFQIIDECRAACGVKIAAPNLENVSAGSEIRTAKTFHDAMKFKEDLKKEIEEVEIETQRDGLILRADTVGSLDALVKMFSDYPIEKAKIGDVTKEDVINVANNSDFYRMIICFNVKPSDDVKYSAKNHDVGILESNVIYRLSEEYGKWTEARKKQLLEKELEYVTRPGKMLLLPGCVFRASNPAIVGCEVQGGIIKSGYKLIKIENMVKPLGIVKQIQAEGNAVNQALAGERVAVSITDAVVGRNINESDIIYTDINSNECKILKKYASVLTDSEIKTLEEICELKRKIDKSFGM